MAAASAGEARRAGREKSRAESSVAPLAASAFVHRNSAQAAGGGGQRPAAQSAGDSRADRQTSARGSGDDGGGESEFGNALQRRRQRSLPEAHTSVAHFAFRRRWGCSAGASVAADGRSSGADDPFASAALQQSAARADPGRLSRGPALSSTLFECISLAARVRPLVRSSAVAAAAARATGRGPRDERTDSRTEEGLPAGQTVAQTEGRVGARPTRGGPAAETSISRLKLDLHLTAATGNATRPLRRPTHSAPKCQRAPSLSGGGRMSSRWPVGTCNLGAVRQRSRTSAVAGSDLALRSTQSGLSSSERTTLPARTLPRYLRPAASELSDVSRAGHSHRLGWQIAAGPQTREATKRSEQLSLCRPPIFTSSLPI